MGDETPSPVTEAVGPWGTDPALVVASGPPRPGASHVRKPGRLVVPLLLVLAALLMGATGAVAWLLVQTRDRLQVRERELVLVSAERDGLRTQLAESEAGRGRAEREVTLTRQELATTQGELARVNTQREELSRSLEERQRQLDQMTAERDAARAAREQLQRQVAGLSDDREQLQQQVVALEDAKQLLESKVVELSQHPTVELDKVLVSGSAGPVAVRDWPAAPPAVLEAPEVVEAPALAEAPAVAEAPASAEVLAGAATAAPPPSTGGPSGEVVVINREYDFIVMNLGRSHGVAVGQELRIMRDGQELGRVRVEKVYDELSAAALLPDAREDQIQEGDAVVLL